MDNEIIKNTLKRRLSLKNKLLKWLKILIILYCTIGTALYFLQENFLFHPEKLSKDFAFHFDMPFQEINIPFNENDTINVVKFFTNDSIKKGVVLYFHGNMQNIIHYQQFVKNFTKHGYEVWMEDYPGFGKSSGTITEKKLYQQALEIEKMAKNKFKEDSIIIYGKSFGTGIAAYVASQTKCKRLILETPYYSVPDMFSCWAPIYQTQQMARYKIPTYQYLQDVPYPITIFHGTDDGVIFYKCAAKLKNVLKPSDEFITIENGTHHNLVMFNLYQQKLDSLLNLQ